MLEYYRVWFYLKSSLLSNGFRTANPQPYSAPCPPLMIWASALDRLFECLEEQYRCHALNSAETHSDIAKLARTTARGSTIHNTKSVFLPLVLEVRCSKVVSEARTKDPVFEFESQREVFGDGHWWQHLWSPHKSGSSWPRNLSREWVLRKPAQIKWIHTAKAAEEKPPLSFLLWRCEQALRKPNTTRQLPGL